ncbi:MAG TPA: hypothetical protein PKG88_04015 [Bacteroidales bacterium]|jgi:peptidoglycan/LPS O-acetylase OafA/YrhL|nr:hypothetical protein [Bacteroidales bacterium]HPS71604.1 hypothetical protein [Bacteroidales bacterium]
MKKSLLVFIVAGLLIIGVVIWITTSSTILKEIDFLHAGIITTLVAFAIFFGIKRFKSEKRKEPVEDEMSKKIIQKTAAFSYYFSLYMWVFIIFIKDRIAIKMDTEEWIGTGVLGMALFFAITWVIFYFKGIKNDE